MAKIVEEIVVVKISRICADDAELTSIVDDKMLVAVQEGVRAAMPPIDDGFVVEASELPDE